MTPAPATPSIEPIADRVPYTVATLRGATDARRVFVEGPGNPISMTVLPDGSFCVDVAMPTPGPYVFRVIAQGDDGQLSDPAVVNVQFDPSAPAIANAQTCSGADPAGCAGSMEICGNNRDDDCNNLIDDQDPACASCVDDALEPNDGPNSPRIDPNRYDGLVLCPGDPDYYGLFTQKPARITARLFFTHDVGDLDGDLIALDGVMPVARATSTNNDESLTYTATASGEYQLLVFGGAGVSNTYALDVEVEDM